jgi:hypothetical protein
MDPQNKHSGINMATHFTFLGKSSLSRSSSLEPRPEPVPPATLCVIWNPWMREDLLDHFGPILLGMG